MTDHIAKPIDTKRLLQALEKWTQGSGPSQPMPELDRQTCRSSDQDVHDPAVWNDLVDILGLERVQQFAERLRSSLVADCWGHDDSVGIKPLAAAAHACVALSGQLGFAGLSAASRDLETACLNEAGLEQALTRLALLVCVHSSSLSGCCRIRLVIPPPR